MFCPKCKYTSFDYLKKCPKCGSDWSSIRKTLNLAWIEPFSESPEDIQKSEYPAQEKLQFTFDESEDIANSGINDVSGDERLSAANPTNNEINSPYLSNISSNANENEAGQEKTDTDSEYLKEAHTNSLDRTNLFFSNEPKKDYSEAEESPSNEVLYPDLETLFTSNEAKVGELQTHDDDEHHPGEDSFTNEYEIDLDELEQSLNQSSIEDIKETSNTSQAEDTDLVNKSRPAKNKANNEDEANEEVDLSSLFEIIDSKPEQEKKK